MSELIRSNEPMFSSKISKAKGVLDDEFLKRAMKLCGFCRGPVDDACCGNFDNYNRRNEYEKIIEEQRKISKDVQRIMK